VLGRGEASVGRGFFCGVARGERKEERKRMEKKGKDGKERKEKVIDEI
jgi:hypothetical protein